jgi:hypothetical protein
MVYAPYPSPPCGPLASRTARVQLFYGLEEDSPDPLLYEGGGERLGRDLRIPARMCNFFRRHANPCAHNVQHFSISYSDSSKSARSYNPRSHKDYGKRSPLHLSRKSECNGCLAPGRRVPHEVGEGKEDDGDPRCLGGTTGAVQVGAARSTAQREGTPASSGCAWRRT